MAGNQGRCPATARHRMAAVLAGDGVVPDLRRIHSGDVEQPLRFQCACCIVDSLDPMPFTTETLYRAHIHRAPVDADRRSWLASRKLPPVEARAPNHQEIARLAYSYWEARGRRHGSELEDWLCAERELRKGREP